MTFFFGPLLGAWVLAAAAQEPPLDDTEEPEVLTVRGQSVSKTQSPEAVTTVDLTQFDLEAADLGQILNRQQGINIQRAGGLGSTVRFSLNGLSGNQVRFFVDGVPLQLAGLGGSVADIPPSLLEGVRIYRGVVPARLGADALGGAIELETNAAVDSPELRASYIIGSFATQRASATAALPLNDDGLFINATAFFDDTDNDFQSLQEVNDPNTGAIDQRLVRRFHDGYRGFGASLVGGWIDHPVLGTLTARAFINGNENELQQGASAFSGDAFGEAETSALSFGALLRFDNEFYDRFRVFGTFGGARFQTSLLDVATCVYSWLGECGPVPRGVPGELGAASDSTQNNDSIYLRASLEAELADNHTLRISFSPTSTRIRGEERLDSGAESGNGIDAERDLFTSVVGVEYELDALGERLETVVFGKWYLLAGESDGFDVLDAELVDLSTSELGGGGLVRFELIGTLDLEASYEYALRLPTPTEFFGIPGQVFPNLDLLPERANNANLGLRLRPWNTPIGVFRSELNGFLRDSTDLIRLVNFLEFLQFDNVDGARSAGAESLVGWNSPGQYVSIDASLTLMDFRNTSEIGEEAGFNGDRVPNIPYRFGSVSARLRLPDVFIVEDELVVGMSARFVDRFFLTWESLGRPDTKIDIDAQLSANANVGYRFRAFGQRMAAAVDAQNVTNESLFDFFGIQRPGRAFFFRLNVDLTS
ncbi:MAG: TonB-dependent receptor [Myxococcota bacterium]